jgi:hypothetical protein
MQASPSAELKTYKITPDAYGTKSWRLGYVILHFSALYLFMFAGFLLLDLLFKKAPEMPMGSQSWLIRNGAESLFVAAFMTLFAISKWFRRMTLEVRPDDVTVYDGDAADPLCRHGQTISRSEVSRVREVRTFSIFGPRSRGLVVRYGHGARWRSKSILIPAGTPDYGEIKAQLTAWSTNRV